MPTKEKVFENLKAKMGSTQKISDRSINELLETLITGAAETETDTDFTERIYPIFDTFNRNLIKENSDAIQKYAAEVGLKKDGDNKGQQTTTPPSTPNGGVATNPELTQLQTSLAELTRKIEQQEQIAAITTKKKQLAEQLVKTHKLNETWSNEYVERFPIGKDDDIAQLSQKALEFYNLTIADVNKNNSPLGAGGTKKDVDISKEFEDVLNLRKENTN